MATEHFYIQVRDAAELRWVAVAESADRHTAERLALNATNEHGGLPSGVRVVSSQDLKFEGGADAVSRAAADLKPHPPASQ